MKINQKGFGTIHLLLALILLVIICGVGWHVFKQRTDMNTPSSHTAGTKPTNFSECVRAGGNVRSAGFGGYTTELAGDTDAETQTCTMVVDHKFTSDSFGADIKDTQCQDAAECMAIKQAVSKVCTTQYIHWTDPALLNAQLEPSFKYYPVIKDDFAMLQLVKCSVINYTRGAERTVFMKKEDKTWQIYKVLDSSSSCEDVDGAGIPLELLYSCTDKTGGFRVPK